MKTHKITGLQLRGMIKEALEESVDEIRLDDERMELARLGHRRSPAQNRRYKALLEAKLGYMKEDVNLSAAAKSQAKAGDTTASDVATKKTAKLGPDGIAKALIPVIGGIMVEKLKEDPSLKKDEQKLKSLIGGVVAKLRSQVDSILKHTLEKSSEAGAPEAKPTGPQTESGKQEGAGFPSGTLEESRRRLLRRR